jgi:hypothetical protein
VTKIAPRYLTCEFFVSNEYWAGRRKKKFRAEIREQAARSIAKRLIKDGLVKLTEAGFDPMTLATIVRARLDYWQEVKP